MFTGIVSDIGTIERIEARGDTRIVIRTGYDTGTIDMGASIACSGVCLTVVERGPGWFAVDVSGETLARTAQGRWSSGMRLNLERAMKLGEEMGGHIVTGHVDGIAEVVEVSTVGDSQKITIDVGREIAPFIAPKGSITIDGVSLTVNTVEDREQATRFSVNIIPHTQGATTLGALQAGHAVNIEIDVLARYLQRMEHYRAKG